MGRRKPPRLVVDPRPAVGADPAPITGVIGRPAYGDVVRIPDVAVFRHIRCPLAVVVQILVADHVFGHVAARSGVVPALVALRIEVVERIRRRQLVGLVVLQLRIVEGHRLALIDAKACVALTVDVTAAVSHGDDGRLAVGQHADAEFADAIGDEGQCWRVDLVDLAVIQAAYAQVQRTLRQFHLRGVVIKIEEIEARLLIQTDRRGADFQRGPGIVVGPQFVAGDQRTIELRFDPVVFTGRNKTHSAVNGRQAGNAGGWVGLV